MEIKNDLDSLDESQQLSQKFKYKVFYVMDRMIDFYHKSFLVEFLFMLIQTFQLIGLINQPWMNISSLTSKFLDFTHMFLFVPFFVSNDLSSQFQIVFYFCSTFILMLIMCFLSASYLIEQNDRISEKQKSSYKLIFSFMDITVNLMTQVLYIPFFQLFASQFRCEKNENYQYSLTESPNSYFNSITKNECFAAIQIPNFIISIICMILIHIFCYFINKMYFDARLDCTYKNSKINGEYELNLQYFVSSFSIVSALLFEEKYQIIRVVFSIISWFNLLKLLNENMQYNYKILSFLKRQQSLILFWTSLIGAYNYFFPGSSIVVFFWIVGILFSTVYNIFYEPVTNEIMAANSSNYRYVNEAIKQLRVLCYAIQRYDQYSLKIDGFLNRHRNDCNLPNCPSRSNAIRIKKFNRILVNQSNNDDMIMSIFVIQTIFNNNILKFGGSNEIRLLYALFLLETVSNKDQALIQLSFLILNQPSLEQQFIAYRLKKVIMQIQNSRDYKKLDFSSDLTIDEYSNKFKKILNTTIQNYVQFWQELLESSPQAQNLLLKGNMLIEQIDSIQNQFDNLTQQRNLNQSGIRCYQAFSVYVLEDKEHFKDLLKQNQLSNEQLVGDDDEQEEENMKEEDFYTQGSIVISSQEENFANIIEVNQEMLKIIGLTKSQVLLKNISYFIPSIWQQYHNQFIDQYLASGQKKIIGQQRDLFIKNRQDYSLPIKINIKPIPSHTQGLLFQASIVAQNLLYDYPAFIITQLNGQIDTISPSVISIFNIDMKKIKQGMFIEKIIPSFWEYILDFQSKQGKDLVIKTYKVKMMKESKVRITVQQIKFLNLGSQGYVISIKLIKSEIKSQQTLMSKKSRMDSSNVLKQQTLSEKLKEKKLFQQEDEFKEETVIGENLVLQSNQNSVFNQSNNSNRSVLKKLTSQLEIFYDLRTKSYQAVQVPVAKQNYYEEQEYDIILKKQAKSIFSQASPKQNSQQLGFSFQQEKFQAKQSLYPYIYSFQRGQEERVKDILENNKNNKQKPHLVDNEVQQILENLIKMQYEKSSKKNKLSSKSQKKSKDSDKNGENILPSDYIKSFEIEQAQREYLNYAQKIILINEQNKDQDQSQNDSENIKLQKDYGQNIKTLRLEQNKLIDLKMINESEEQNSENSNQNIENDEQMLLDESMEGDFQKEIDEVCIFLFFLFKFISIENCLENEKLIVFLIKQIVFSKKNIKSFMKDTSFNHNSSFFTCKKIILLLFLVFEIVYICLSLVLYEQKANQTITRFQMYNATHLFYANTQHLIEGIFNMFAIDKGAYYNMDSLDQSQSQFYFQKYLESETMYQFGLDEILTKLYLNNVGVTQQMDDLLINSRNIIINIHFSYRKPIVYPVNLYQASQQVLAKVYHYKRIPLGQFDYHNHDILTILENFSNQMLNQMIQYRDLQEEEIFSFIDSIQTYNSNILFIGLLFIFAYLIIFFALYLKTLFCYYEIPSILTTIPLSQIRSQIKIYEQLQNNALQQEDEDDLVSNDVQQQKIKEEEANEQLSQPKIQEHKNPQQSNISKFMSESKSPSVAANFNKLRTQNTIKIQKNQNVNIQIQDQQNSEQVFSLRGITSQNVRPIKYSIFNLKLIIPFFFSLIFYGVFILVDNNFTQNFTNLLSSFYQELTYSAKLEPEFLLLYNCLKSETITNNYIGVRQVYEPIVYFQKNINKMHDLVSNYTFTHYNNYNNLPGPYQIQYDEYFSENPNICSQLQEKYPYYINETECVNLIDGQFNQGMNINLEHLITKMIYYSQTILDGNITLPYKHSVNKDMYQVQQITTYMKYIMRELNDLLINGTESLSQSLNVIRIAISIALSSLLFSVCLFISIPLIQQIKSNIFNQRQIYSIIPLSLMTKNKHIRNYILKQYLSNNKK